MTNPLVECIPNFSDARRPEVIEAIMEAISSVPEVSLLDRHSDLDHNRTVLTFIGPPSQVEEAAFSAIAKAAELIDLNEHTGEHPRIGATDVVPFVPISDVSMQECIDMANSLGKRVGEELNIPVYLYEEAAKKPERVNLENIRRGQFEGLKGEIHTNPDRRPDYGPSQVGPAGATVIGARNFLIAFNVYLSTDDVETANKIAKAIRHSSGGLRYVKALGLLVEGQAQISMNLTNFRKTPVSRVVEMIRREAARYGVNVHHSELVGLIPQDALVDAAQWYLQLDQFEPEQILEYRLAAARKKATELTPQGLGLSGDFLKALAASTPTPGGGSAAAYSGAAGAALVSMVARLTIGKKKYAAAQEEMKRILTKSNALCMELTEAIERDAQAFRAVMDAFMLPKGTGEEKAKRSQAIQQATLGAAKVPLEVAEMTVQVIDLALSAITHGNINAISDGATGAALARAGLTGAGYNVRINLSGLEDQETSTAMIQDLVALEEKAAETEQKIRFVLTERGGISPA